MGVLMDLPDLRVARYRFALEPLETIHLPPYKGSSLRGGFGHALKRLVCYHSHGVCQECGLGNDCVYGYLFETAPPDDTEVLSTHEAVPRPFIIQPPRDRRSRFEPGQELAFYLVLVGHGVAYLPYFVLGFQELGKAGLGAPVETSEGKRRGTYVLREVQALPFAPGPGNWAPQLEHTSAKCVGTVKPTGCPVQVLTATRQPEVLRSLHTGKPTKTALNECSRQGWAVMWRSMLAAGGALCGVCVCVYTTCRG